MRWLLLLLFWFRSIIIGCFKIQTTLKVIHKLYISYCVESGCFQCMFFLTERSVVCSSIIWFSANRLWQLVWFQHQCGFPIFITTISLRLVWITLLEAGCLLSGSIIENWLLLRKSSLLTRHMFRVSLSDAQFFFGLSYMFVFFFLFVFH